MRLLFFSIFLLSISNIPFVSATKNSPRTAVSLSSSTMSLYSPTSVTPTSSNPISTVTIPTKAGNSNEEKENEAEGFLTAAKATVTPAPEVIIDGAGRVLTLVHGEGGVEGLQEKWHLTTFTSCHTFDATYFYCGIHEPVLPGGDEIAAAVRPLDARGGIVRAVMVVLGTLAGVDVFLR